MERLKTLLNESHSTIAFPDIALLWMSKPVSESKKLRSISRKKAMAKKAAWRYANTINSTLF